MALWPLGAQAGAIDYPALFDTHADKITEGGTRDGSDIDVLKMPEGIELYRYTDPDGATRYDGMDVSGRGAVGCLYDLYFELNALAKSCRWTPSPHDARVLEQRLRRITRFVMANAQPALDPAEVDAHLAAQLEQWRETGGAEACTDPDHGIQGFAGALASDAFEGVLDFALAVPRLPVDNPCL
ncbi:hypothetical protein [Sagittula sp. SSi028]|uniref:hypothetical protein n=1 Tax=Sagittula sp. SSi028 TaxID=3400636 RepID=UPI003AF64FE9